MADGVRLDLDDELIDVLRAQGELVEHVARELIVMELYRRQAISRGKAAELLRMRLEEFLDHAGSLGIPYVEYTEEEWAAELASVDDLVRAGRRRVGAHGMRPYAPLLSNNRERSPA